MATDWSEIHEDMLVSIAKKLPTLMDYFCTTKVCQTWRSYLNPLIQPQPPFLLLAEEDEQESSVHPRSRRFISLDNKEFQLHLPELYLNRCIGSIGNWLFLVNKELQVSIFNPFTRIQCSLPSQSTLPDQFPNEYGDWTQEMIRDRFLSKLVLSSTPNVDFSNVIAITVYGARRRLAIAKPGDRSWLPIEHTLRAEMAIDDVIFCKNRFYFVNRSRDVAFYDIHDGGTSPIEATLVAQDFKSHSSKDVNKYYLVEWMGELLIVLKYCPLRGEYSYYKTEGFELFKFDFRSETWEEVKNLGQHSLFLGFNSSISLLACASSTFRENCIYFTDDYMYGYYGNDTEGGRDMGVFDLMDGTITPHFDGISISMYSSPLWIIPRSLY